MMHITVYPSPERASQAAAQELAHWLTEASTLVVAGGNSPREMYRFLVGLPVPNPVLVFTLDEFLGVPMDGPRTCTNLIRREVADAWAFPPSDSTRLAAVSRTPRPESRNTSGNWQSTADLMRSFSG